MDTRNLKNLFLITFVLCIRSVDNCGHVHNLRSKIIGGESVQNVAYPWFAAVGLKIIATRHFEPFCGGTLVTKKEVILAAHCFQDIPNFDQICAIYFGIQNLCNQWRHGNRVLISKHLLHPKYKFGKWFNDIAIITLQKEINYEPICLPTASAKLPHSGEVIGFGISAFIYNFRMRYCQLQRLNIPVSHEKVCHEIYQNFGGLEKGVFCAGDLSGRRDACQGDSGGPFQYQQQGQYTIYGIVSFGLGCAVQNSLAVYVDVRYYLKWILENINIEK